MSTQPFEADFSDLESEPVMQICESKCSKPAEWAIDNVDLGFTFACEDHLIQRATPADLPINPIYLMPDGKLFKYTTMEVHDMELAQKDAWDDAQASAQTTWDEYEAAMEAEADKEWDKMLVEARESDEARREHAYEAGYTHKESSPIGSFAANVGVHDGALFVGLDVGSHDYGCEHDGMVWGALPGFSVCIEGEEKARHFAHTLRVLADLVDKGYTAPDAATQGSATAVCTACNRAYQERYRVEQPDVTQDDPEGDELDLDEL